MRGKLALAGFSFCVFGLVHPVLAQQGGAGQGTGGQNQQGQRQGQGQGQGQGQANQGQAGQRTQSFGYLGDRPWFRDPAIRRQLGWNDDVFNRMNTLYGTQWQRFSTAAGGLSNLNEQERAQRMRDLTTNFYRDFNQGIGETLNADQRTRFNQLWMQWRGPDAFTDATLQQRLRLTDEQNQQMLRLADRYNNDFRQISSETNDQNAARRFTELRQNLNQQINQILTPEQQTQWRGIIGDPYNFQWYSDRRAGGDNPSRPN